jgi:hypothetical protein
VRSILATIDRFSAHHHRRFATHFLHKNGGGLRKGQGVGFPTPPKQDLAATQ